MRKDLVVNEGEDGRHLRSLLEEVLYNVPAKGIRRAIQRGQILVNKSRVPSNHVVLQGDQISIHIQTKRKKAGSIIIPVIDEDDQFGLLNKPPDINVGGGREVSVADYLSDILQESLSTDALLVPKSVHRLDKQTSGLLLIAKTKSALSYLSGQFEQRTINKSYSALVHNLIADSGCIDTSLSGQDALTYFKMIKSITSSKGQFSMVELQPKTGRTHQLRKHMAYIGHPIVGDKKYGKRYPQYDGGMMLCATGLDFSHPVTKEALQYKIELPSRFLDFLTDL